MFRCQTFFNNSLAISDIKIQQLFVNLSQTAQNHYYLKIPIKISTFHSQKPNIFFCFLCELFWDRVESSEFGRSPQVLKDRIESDESGGAERLSRTRVSKPALVEGAASLLFHHSRHRFHQLEAAIEKARYKFSFSKFLL